MELALIPLSQDPFLLWATGLCMPIHVFDPKPTPLAFGGFVPLVITWSGTQEQEVSLTIPLQHFCHGEGACLLLCLSCPLSTDVDVIVKFAQLEFQLGDAERAKAMFENTLSTYPKRTDVWSVYIDMTIKHSSQKEVR